MWIWLAVVVILILLLHLAFPKNYHWPRAEWELSKIPGPPCIPYFGNAHLFNISTDEFLPLLMKVVQQYQPVMKLNFIGHYFVACTDPEDLKVVLNSPRHISKGIDYQMFEPWLGQGLLTGSGEKWAKNRKLLTPAFHFKILNNYVDVINRNTEILLSKIADRSKEDFIEMDPLISLCTLDVICETAMGTKINAQTIGNNEYVKAVLRMGLLFRIRQISPWLQRDWVFNLSPPGREQKRCLNIIHGFINKVIQERKEAYIMERKSTRIAAEEDQEAEEKKKLSFLDILMEMAEGQKKMTEDDVRAEVNTFMFEGHDTTSSGILWTLYELGRNPDIQEKAYEEIGSIFKDSNRLPTKEDLTEMKYLESIIKEGLRLYPSVPMISRNLKEDVKIRDYVIPAGANFFIFPYCVHRNPKIYPDPDKFDPDRFSPENMQHRHPFAYIPFSAGPRNCIGQRFAMMEEKLILSQILRRFKVISLDKREDIIQLTEMILRPKNPLKMKFEPR